MLRHLFGTNPKPSCRHSEQSEESPFPQPARFHKTITICVLAALHLSNANAADLKKQIEPHPATPFQERKGLQVPIEIPRFLPDFANGFIDASGQDELFTFEAHAGQTYRILTFAPEQGLEIDDTVLFILDRDGVTELGQNDDIQPGINLYSAVNFLCPETGLYFARVMGFQNEIGGYNIAFAPTTDDHDSTGGTQTLIFEDAEPLIGNLGHLNAAMNAVILDDVDGFVLNAIAGTRYVAEARPSSFLDSGLSLTLGVFDSTGAVELGVDESVTPRVRFTAETDGVHFIQITETTASETGTYSIRVLTDDHPNEADGATQIPLFAPNAFLGEIETAADTDYFAFEAHGGVPYSIFATTPMDGGLPNDNAVAEIALSIVDRDGISELAINNDFVETNRFARIDIGFNEDAIYFVRVIGRAFPDTLGEYLIFAGPMADDHGDDLNTATPINTEGEIVRGNIGHSPDGFSSAFDDRDVFAFNVMDGSVYSAETRPSLIDSGIDTLLEVFDSAGNLIDSSKGLDSAIQFTAQVDDTFFARVSGRAMMASGTYALTVTNQGPAPVEVPNLVGLTQAEATAAILATTPPFAIGLVSQADSATVPIGSVVSQNPRAASFADAGSAIDIVLSLGLAVPDVRGQVQGLAEAMLRNAGLTIGAITMMNNANVPAGSVISQGLMAGTRAEPGSAVTLVVSSGPQAPDTGCAAIGLSGHASSPILDLGAIFLIAALLGMRGTSRRKTKRRLGIPSIAIVASFLLAAPTHAQVLTSVQALFESGLHRVESIAISPDGNHLYAGHTTGIHVFERASDGGLNFVQQLRRGVDGINGLTNVPSVVVSPDGAHVYVSSPFFDVDDDEVFVCARDAATGMLTRVTPLPDTSGNTFRSPDSILISPDGAHAYILFPSENAINVYARNIATGQLTFIESIVNGQDGVAGLSTPLQLAMTPDGFHVYASSAMDDAVVGFFRDATTGRLSFVETIFGGVDGVPALDGISGITVSPDGANVYVADFFSQSVVAFSRTVATGRLTFLSEANDALGMVSTIAQSADGAFLYTGATGVLNVLARATDTGGLTRVETIIDEGNVGNFETASIRAIAASPDDAQVYVVSHRNSALATFARNATNGTLTLTGTEPSGYGPAFGLFGANHVTSSPDGRHVYVVSNSDDAVAIFARDTDSGELTPVDTIFNNRGIVTGLGNPVSATVSSNGNHVYVTSTSDSNMGAPSAGSIALFSRDTVSGALTFVGNFRDDQDTALYEPTHVTLSPDGRHAYVPVGASDFVGALNVFSRNLNTGALSFIERFRAGDGVTMGLNSVRFAAVSPDGNHVYALSAGNEHAVVLFARDSTTGQLTFVQAVFDSVDAGEFGIPADAVISADGSQLYVLGFEGGIATFNRDATTGMISLANVAMNGTDGLTALRMAPDGDRVFAVSFNNSAVTVFNRNATTGALTFVESIANGQPGGEGLFGAANLHVTPDGRDLYVASRSGAVAAYAIDNGEPPIEMPQPGCSASTGKSAAPDMFVFMSIALTMLVWRRNRKTTIRSRTNRVR